MDGKTKIAIAVVAVVVIVACVAAYSLYDDGEPADDADHQEYKMPDRLLVLDGVGEGVTGSGTVDIAAHSGNRATVDVSVSYGRYYAGMDIWRLDYDVAATDGCIKSLTVESSIEDAWNTMMVWDGYDTNPEPLGGTEATIDFDSRSSGYVISVESPGMGTELSVENSDGWMEVGVDDGQYAVKVVATVVYEYFNGDTITYTGELDIWLPGVWQPSA